MLLVSVGVRWLVHPAGTAAEIVDVVGVVGLVVWAVDEVGRGINPFRRLLRAVVLVAQAAALAHRFLH